MRRIRIQLNGYAITGLAFSLLLGVLLLAESSLPSTYNIVYGVGLFWTGFLLACSGDADATPGSQKVSGLLSQFLSFIGIALMAASVGWVVLWSVFRFSGRY